MAISGTGRETMSFRHAYGVAGRIVDSLDSPFFNEIVFPDFVSESEESFVQRAHTPSKWTLLHSYTHSVFSSELDYLTDKWDEDSGAIAANVIETADLEPPSWLYRYGDQKPDGERLSEVDSLLESAARRHTMAAFHLLFADREFLMRFHQRITQIVRQLDPKVWTAELTNNGTIRRKQPPQWVKYAVNDRDRNRCQECTLTLGDRVPDPTAIRYDHMVPLKLGGTNDPTNIQLLCQDCNSDKSATTRFHRTSTATWW